ncbi:killer toxin resistant protein [Kickxella alabastrina]|nr:killer toxin resistant protein [Kickxella alabastrina]
MRTTQRALCVLAALSMLHFPVYASGPAASTSSPIRTRLLSSFAAPPLLLEVAEGIATHNSSAYFPFLLKLASNNDVFTKSDADTYAQALQWIEQDSLLEPFAQSLMKLELSVHAHAPAVVAQYQMYNSNVVLDIREARGANNFDDSCTAWAQYKDKQACSVEALNELLDIEKFYGDTYIEESKVVTERLGLDHVYRPDAPLLPKIVVLYADPRAESFVGMHEHLVMLADNSEVTYILRYRPWDFSSASDSDRPLLGLSGYGVELALKSTEYKVIDDRDLDYGSSRGAAKSGGSKLAVQGPNASGNSGEFAIFESETEPIVKGLSEKLISDLGIQATQMVLSADEVNRLAVLKQLAQDLPRYAHLLSEVPINSTLAASIKDDALDKYGNRLLINGFEVEDENLDPFGLLEHLRKENSVISSLEHLGVSQTQAIELIIGTDTADDAEGANTLVFDMRDKSQDQKTVLWLNDLEKDRRYSSWPSDIQNLKRMGSPGMIQRIRKNIVQVVFALDMSQPDTWVLAFEELMANVEHGLPMQFGIVPLIDYSTPDQQSVANSMAKYVLYLRRSFKRKEWHSIIKGALVSHYQVRKANPGAMPALFIDSARSIYEAYIKSHNTKDDETPLGWEQIVGSGGDTVSWLSRRWADTVDYCARLDLSPASTPSGMVFVNGEQFSMGKGYQQNVFNAFQMKTWDLAQKLRLKEFTPEDGVQEFVYGRGAASSRNTLIYVSDDNPLRILPLGQPLAMQWMDHDVRYLDFGSDSDASEGREQIVSTWVIGDLASGRVRQVAVNALAAAKKDTRMRVALIHVPQLSDALKSNNQDEDDEQAEEAQGYDVDAPQIVYQLVVSGVEAEVVAGYLRGAKSAVAALGDKQARLLEPLDEFINDAELEFTANRAVLSSMNAIPADADSCYVAVNGRIIPTITPTTLFNEDTFVLLAALEEKERIGAVRSAMAKVLPDVKPSEVPSLLLKISAVIEHSKTLLQSDSVMQRRKQQARQLFDVLPSTHATAPLTTNEPGSARMRIQVVLDPLSETAQKWAPLLETLVSMPSVSLELWMVPKTKMTELPVKRFYRYLWPSKPEFGATGSTACPEVVFNGIPADPLLTLGMDVPSAWLVTAVESIHDLDNIRLSSLRDVSAGISATYKLVNILVEGHLVDTNSRSPARGIEVRLGTSSEVDMTDTIVMANLGYLQLKANPGVWKFSIRPGRSADIYKIDHIGDGRWNYRAAKQAGPDHEYRQPVIVSSFRGTTIFPLVSKRPGKETEDVLESSDTADSKAASGSVAKDSAGGLWGKLRSSFGGGSDVAAAKGIRPHFDVFAVASGHLYERLMSIMIMSVLNNTSSHVKFWLIENFLSPSFKAFVPHMAEEFGFDFEFVTYKWPHWLNHETEKQRTIWGYKILFLDVLFPLNLDRVIFVDADQIVRADLQELADMDLQGAPYGYVPFCDDRKEIDGYRFWKNGWWKDHLRGKPYHISALYVVDLKRFRQLAAGDRLRGQYQMLSRDSNSLANLDQDLPNNMQHLVPIFSLPQEWLWCETWCSDAALGKAKTIDLCNNPMTKEPKLVRARRLLPEWELFDKQVADFTKVLAQRGKHEGAQIADAEAINIDLPEPAPEVADPAAARSNEEKHDEL